MYVRSKIYKLCKYSEYEKALFYDFVFQPGSCLVLFLTPHNNSQLNMVIV